MLDLKSAWDSGTIAAEFSYRIRIHSTGTRTEDNCSHDILLDCPRNGLEYESPLRFHLLKEPAWNLSHFSITLIISGCLAFGLNQWGRNRIANGKEISNFLRVFCYSLDNHDAEQEIAYGRAGDQDGFIRKLVKAVTHFFKSFSTKKQQRGKDGATLIGWT